MSPSLRNLAPALLLAVAVAGGCSYRELADTRRAGSSAHNLRDMERSSLEGAQVVVGGVVLGAYAPLDDLCGVDPGITAEDYLAQADAWSHCLHTALAAHADHFSIWPWPEVRDRVSPTDLATTLKVFAGLAVLRADRLSPVREAFPQADFLLIARVDYNVLEDRSLTQASGLSGSIGRTVEITLECYDLESLSPVWRTTQREHDFGKHIGLEGGQDPHTRVRRLENGQTNVEVPGITASAPLLEDMIGGTLRKLVFLFMQQGNEIGVP